MKRLIRVTLFFFIILANNLAFATDNFPIQLSTVTGNISTSFAESQPTIKSTDGTASEVKPYSGSATTMPLEISLEFFSNVTRSYFFKVSGPLMSSTADRLFYGAAGMNFYFKKLGTNVNISNEKITLKLVPKFRYYLGFQGGADYLIYNTKSQTKNDIIAEIEGHVGGIYAIKPKWGLKAEAGFGRGIGALVTSSTMRILLGTTYSIE